MGKPLALIFFSFTLLGGAYLAGSFFLSAGTIEQPGAGFFPRIVGVFIFCLGMAGWIGSLRSGEGKKSADPVFPEGKNLQRVIALALVILLFAVLLQTLGYWICSAFLMGAVLRLLGMRSWGQTIILALLTAGVSYFFFVLLDIPLPRGSLFP